MASRSVPRTHTEKQALKLKTKKSERQRPQSEGRRRDFVNEIEFNNAATGGHGDDPIPTTPNSRSAVADAKRAAAKGAGVMSLSTKIDPELALSSTREPRAADTIKKGRAAQRAKNTPDKGLSRTGGMGGGPGDVGVKRTKSNAEIADGVATTARRSPAPPAAPMADGDTIGAVGGQKRPDKRSGGLRQRVPAPGTVVSVTKGELTRGRPPSKVTGVRSTSSSGGSKPPKRSARGGEAKGTGRSKGADLGLDD